MATLLPERQFSEAKSGLSELMNDVVHRHRPQVIRRHTRDRALLVRSDDALRWLGGFRLDLITIFDPGHVSVVAQPLGVIGIGASLDEALDSLVENIRAYTEAYFASEFQVPDPQPYLLRFALTDPEHHRALLDDDIEDDLARNRQATHAE